MVRALVTCLVAGSLLVPLGASGPAQAKPANVAASTWSPSQPPADLTEFYKEISKSVVTVVCGNSRGSGWAQYYWSDSNRTQIYTNEHVVTDCGYGESVLIVQGDKQWVGDLRQKNAEVDYADIRVDAFIQPLQTYFVPYPVVGQWVAAFGSPLGLAGSMTTGIVSFVGSDFVTTTATLDYGNSGGPLVDSAGRVIAMNTGIVSNTFYAVGTPAFVAAWTLAAAPSVPRNFRIVSAVGTTATVAWDPPADEGAAGISSYQVRANPGTSYCSAGPTSNSCTLTDLVIGTPYKFFVFALSQFGPSADVWLSSSFTPTVTKPDQPSNIKATWDGKAKAVTVTWTAPNDGGSPITGSVATLTPTGQSCVVAGTGTSCTIGGVTDPESLGVMVAAENQQGRGAWRAGSGVSWVRIDHCVASLKKGRATFKCEVLGSQPKGQFDLRYRVKPKKSWKEWRASRKSWSGSPTRASVQTNFCSGTSKFPTCTAVQLKAHAAGAASNVVTLKNVVKR